LIDATLNEGRKCSTNAFQITEKWTFVVVVVKLIKDISFFDKLW